MASTSLEQRQTQEVSQSVTQSPPVTLHHHHNNGWSTRAEKLVRYWQEECRLYAWIYEQNVTYYSRLNRTLGIASITLSAITGTTLFNQSASGPDSTSSNILIGLGISSIASTILSGLKELLDLNALITQNTNAARENSSIVMDIDEQMNIDRSDRTDGREFLKSIKDRKNSLIQNGPIIPSRQWKQVHKKIQSKEQFGFLNREVFNEYLEQSVDINKLQFGGGGGGGNCGGGIDYGTPSSNSNMLGNSLDGSTSSGSVAIDMPGHQTLPKRATVPEKVAFYGGHRLQVLPICPEPPTPADLQTLGKEIENLQPRSAARKAILENQYELERLLSKTGELKNKDRQQITNLRDKSRVYRESYQKLCNDSIADYNSIINSDFIRVARIVKAYRDGGLSESELFRVIQLDLMEIDNETFQDESRLMELIFKTRQKLATNHISDAAVANNVSKPIDAETATRYPFRTSDTGNETPTHTNSNIYRELPELIDYQKNIHLRLQETSLEMSKLGEIASTCQDSDMRQEVDTRISGVTQMNNELQREYANITNKIAEITSMSLGVKPNAEITSMSLGVKPNAEITSMSLGVKPNAEITSMSLGVKPNAEITSMSLGVKPNAEITSFTPTMLQYNPLLKQMNSNSARTATNNYPTPLSTIAPDALTSSSSTISHQRPSSTVPSDDEFIETMYNDNLCAKQLQDMIKPVVLSNSQPTSPGQDGSSNSTKSPKRRTSKYDAQMRYQTGRIN